MCALLKPIADFAFRSRVRGTLQDHCRSCQASYRRKHYREHRLAYIGREVARIRRYRDENRPRIQAYLRAHPCVDCGETDTVLLEFDHRDPATKARGVTRLALEKPWTRVLAEIEKCDLRCVNCHRARTARQFGWHVRGKDATNA